MKETKETLKVTKYTNMKSSDAESVVGMLNTYLATLTTLYANLRGYHWHVRGALFSVIHEHTEEMYDQIADQIDEVAERIIMLDGIPVRRFDDVKKLTKIQEAAAEALSCGKEITMAVLDDIKVLTDMERKGIETAEDANDPVTADLLTGYLAGHEKQAWMLSVTLQ